MITKKLKVRSRKMIRNKHYLKQMIINIGVFLSFCVLSYLYIRPLLITGNIYMGDDAWYHINRIIEVKRNIEVGNFFLLLLFYRSEEHTSELQSRFDIVCRV